MGIYTEAVQKLYVAYFSRPADFGGLNFWEKVITDANGDTSAVSAAFAASQEYKDTYEGKSSFQIINTIYQNLFGRDAEPAALLFWGNALNNNDVTIDSAVTTIAAAAQTTDATAYANKVAAATAFSAAIDTTSEILGYSGAAANGAAREWLAGVTTDASLAAAIEPATLNASIGVVAGTGTGNNNNGQTYQFTKGLDNLNGTAGNDLFIASISANEELNTLSALDVVNGGGGIDTLRVLTDGTAEQIQLPNMRGIEILEAQSSSDVWLDASNVSELTNLNVTRANGDVQVQAASSTDVAVTLANPGTGNGGSDHVWISGGKNIAVNLTDVRDETNIEIGDFEGGEDPTGTVNVNVTGTAYTAGRSTEMGDIDVSGGTTVSVTQKAAANTTAAGTDRDVGTVTQGDVFVGGNQSTTTVTVKQDAAVAAVNARYTTGGTVETASVKFSALTAGQSITLGVPGPNSGVAGLEFTAEVDMTAAEVAAAFSNLIDGALLNGGDTQGSGPASKGYYTGYMSGWTSGAASGDTVVFTSTTPTGDVANLVSAVVGTGASAVVTPTAGASNNAGAAGGVMGVVAGDVVVRDDANTITTVSIDGYSVTGSGLETGGNVLATLNLSNGGSFTATDAATTLNLNLEKVWAAAAVAATRTSSAVAAQQATITIEDGAETLNVKSTGANAAKLSAGDATALNVSGTGTLNAAGSTLGALKTITVTETAGLNLGSTALTNVESVNTTGTTGSVSVAILGEKASYTGGAGADSVTLAAASTGITKSISLGAGNDRLNLGNLDAAKLGAIADTVTLSGGEGTDTLVLNAAAAQTLSGSAAFGNRIDGFERLEVNKLVGNAAVNLANLDNINYVISNGGEGVGAAPLLTAATATQGNAGATESAAVAFGSVPAGGSYIVAGRTIEVAGGSISGAEVASYLLQGPNVYTTAGGATVTVTISNQATADLWTVAASALSSQVLFTSTTPYADVTNVTVNTTGGAATAAVTPIEGVNQVTESQSITFGALTAGQSYTIGGRTITAIVDQTAAQVAAAFLANASTSAVAISGTLAGWSVADNTTTVGTADLLFTSTTPNANVTDLVYEGNQASTNATLTLNNMASGATVQLNAAGSVTVNLADATGTADVVNFVANSTAVQLGTVTANKVETINFTANDSDSSTTIAVSTNLVTVSADAAKTINVTGAGNFGLTLGEATTKAVTLIDASTATGSVWLSSSANADAVAVTINGGSGDDVLTSAGNKADVLVGGAGADTLIAGRGLATLTGGAGDDLFKISVASDTVNSYATITDFSAGDLLQFSYWQNIDSGSNGGPIETFASSFSNEKIALGATAVFQDYANAAIKAIKAIDGEVTWFQFGGDTYVVADRPEAIDATPAVAETFINGQDFIVKLTGLIDLNNASFNAEFGTIGLV